MTSVHKKIAVFGGSFNPPHSAHRQVLEYLKGLGRFDEVWVLPVYSHPFEKSLVPWASREALCRLLIQELEPLVSVCSIEGETKRDPSYTIDTVCALKKKHPHFFFTLVVGSDCKNDLPHWKDFEKLQKEVDFLFVPRPGFENSPFADVSSTEIREKIRKGESIKGLVLPAVADYIRQHNLYK